MVTSALPGAPWHSKEARLLMALALAKPSNGALEIADDLLNQNIDWNRFSRLSLRHALAPLMGSHLANDPRVPKSVSQGLAAITRKHSLKNLRMTSELLALTKAFSDANVPMISVKGPALAYAVDGHLGQRMIGDLDILIPPDRSPEAIDIIVSRGFLHQRDFALNNVDDGLFRPADGLYIELHRRLGMPWLPFHLPLQEMFAKREYAPLGNDQVPILPLEENLLYLCYHGAKHGWSRMAWLTGFIGLLQVEGKRIGAERLARRSEELHLTIAMGSALRIARDHMHIGSLPPSLMTHLEDPAVIRFTELCLQDGFDEHKQSAPDVEASALLMAFGGLQTGAIGPEPSTQKLIPQNADRDSLLHMPQKSRNLHARTIYASLGGNVLRYSLRTMFSPSSSHIKRFGVSANNRLFYAIIIPIDNAIKAIGFIFRKAKTVLSGT